MPLHSHHHQQPTMPLSSQCLLLPTTPTQHSSEITPPQPDANNNWLTESVWDLICIFIVDYIFFMNQTFSHFLVSYPSKTAYPSHSQPATCPPDATLMSVPVNAIDVVSRQWHGYSHGCHPFNPHPYLLIHIPVNLWVYPSKLVQEQLSQPRNDEILLILMNFTKLAKTHSFLVQTLFFLTCFEGHG